MEKFDEKGYYDAREAKYIENSSNHFDAAESIFFARQLAYVRGKILEVLKGAQTAYQRIYDSYGMAEIISNAVRHKLKIKLPIKLLLTSMKL